MYIFLSFKLSLILIYGQDPYTYTHKVLDETYFLECLIYIYIYHNNVYYCRNIILSLMNYDSKWIKPLNFFLSFLFPTLLLNYSCLSNYFVFKVINWLCPPPSPILLGFLIIIIHSAVFLFFGNFFFPNAYVYIVQFCMQQPEIINN